MSDIVKKTEEFTNMVREAAAAALAENGLKNPVLELSASFYDESMPVSARITVDFAGIAEKLLADGTPKYSYWLNDMYGNCHVYEIGRDFISMYTGNVSCNFNGTNIIIMFQIPPGATVDSIRQLIDPVFKELKAKQEKYLANPASAKDMVIIRASSKLGFHLFPQGKKFNGSVSMPQFLISAYAEKQISRLPDDIDAKKKKEITAIFNKMTPSKTACTGPSMPEFTFTLEQLEIIAEMKPL